MVRRRLVRSRSEAKSLILDGKVVIPGIESPRPASSVGEAATIEIEAGRRWVSRGARKLVAALDAFGIDPAGRDALDAGSSTGGFTEVLLHRSARSVVCVDVGRDQLHESLRNDPRVVALEQTDIRSVDSSDLGGPISLVVADLSFISLCAVAGSLAAIARPEADVVVLVKPQFESTRADLGRTGVIRDPEVVANAVGRVVACLTAAGLNPQGIIESPITGGDGNVEYLLWARMDRPPAKDLPTTRRPT